MSVRVRAPSRGYRVALVGNPNTGKTTLFNRLSGARAKTSNFPGTTTAARIGHATLGNGGAPVEAELVDLPGLYRLGLSTPESTIAREVLGGEGLYRKPDAVVVVVDACNLTRNLVLVGELLAYDEPVVVALNMVDLAQRRGLTLDAAALSRAIGCPVVPIVARRGEAVDRLTGVVADVLRRGGSHTPPGLTTDRELEAWADRAVEASVTGVGSGADTLTERLDKAFTHPVLGVLVFAAVMGGMFWTLFALATVPMDLIEAVFAQLGAWVNATLPDGAIRDLAADGIIGGIAGSAVFLPQICLLFFLISLLEDTGYLARAAFVMDRLLCRFGLPGHAFVPLLSSHACALPGIMATRLIPDRRDRLATILVAPLMSCSARLPVYVFLTSMLFVGRPLYAAIAFAGCYLLGAVSALVSAAVLRRTLVTGTARPMVLELPSYKPPSLRNALISARDQGFAFLKTAGTIIMAISIVMWWLSAYPKADAPADAIALQQRAEATVDAAAAGALRAEADTLQARAQQQQSFAGRIGRLAQPVFAPLGYDWQLTVGVLTSFLAREVFVSTMSVLLGGSDDPDLADIGVIDRIRQARRDDGSLLFTPATSASALVFFVLAMQCMSTLAVTRAETGGFKWAGIQLAYMSALAYTAALITYQGLRAAGVQ